MNNIMKKEDTLLLIRDLCARLPYGVKGINMAGLVSSPSDWYCAFGILGGIENRLGYSEWKPYLFPMSSMTEEQYETLEKSEILSNCSHSYEYVNPHIHGNSFVFKGFKTYSLELIEWLNKNKFDYRGLIEKSLALDATNLGIYE